MKITGRHIAGATGALLIAGTLITGFEGRVLHVYADPVSKGPPWTYCDGETRDPKFGHDYTDAECDAITLKELRATDSQVVACTGPQHLPDKVRAAFDSLAWNIGVAGFCKSSIAVKAKHGDLTGACKAILLYNRAGGREIPGLTFRRGEEENVCLDGVVGK